MPDERDPIADTGMFRAFAERRAAEEAEQRSPGVPLIAGLLIALVALAVLAWFFLLR